MSVSIINIKNPWLRRTVLVLAIGPVFVACVAVEINAVVGKCAEAFVSCWRGRETRTR